jgi:FAD/FMN-containing dehydrogenase
VDASSVEKLKASVRGAVLWPGQDGYDAARTIPNAMIDRRPAVITRCAGAADVMQCVRFAREHGLVVSVRGGGHSVAGKSVCHDGLMIDLSAMKGIRVDPQNRTVRAEPGLTLGECDAETNAFGLTTPLGTVTKTGISGLTLGGGWGHLHARFGLALDNLTEVDVVTADGKLLKASATENPDLFWGVRGSGGNLGIVTSLEYQLYEVGPVLGGGVFYPVRQGKEVLRFYREITRDIPDELVLQAATLDLPAVGPVMGIAACYSGPLAEGEKVLQPIRKFGTPVADIIAPISFVQMQSLFDPFFPPGRHVYVKSNFIAELSDVAIEVLAEYAQTRPSPHSFAPAIEHWHGAATRVPVTETAFPHRKHSYNFMAWSVWEASRDTEKNVAWTRKFWEDLRPYLVAGSYGNYVSDEGDASARAAYGENYDRLVTLKNKYDPTNFFRMNHNIRPTV